MQPASKTDRPAPKKKDNFDWKQQRVKDLFTFMETHQQWNREFQRREYERCLGGATTSRERLVRFLHWNVNTQQKANLDALARFWEVLHRAGDEQTASLQGFTAYLLENAATGKQLTTGRTATAPATNAWHCLRTALRAHRGWGEKTTALFVKATIQLHRGPSSLHFWPDAKPELAPLDSIRPHLPVDRVILRIFGALGHPCPRFDNINKGLQKEYSAEQMLIWDDLWFWGFFTQKSNVKSDADNDETDSGPDGTDDSTLGWNPGKFWGQLSSPKEQEPEVRRLGTEFLKLLK